ncbi:MAG: right-handed parallel beta-helix repeat-containing protein [Phycisphaerae bacterium]|nr:right-handed parallel beta-helix repeat-containing protein [Phycisphaerae bacterium]
MPHSAALTSPASQPTTAPTTPIELYVAVGGSDLSPGTKSRPLASLEGARDAIRRMREDAPLTRPVIVWIRGGDYFRTDTFKLTREDAGTIDAPIVYRGYPGECPRLIGGRAIQTGWCHEITNDSVRNRLDPTVRSKVVEVDLRANGIEDYGEMSILAPMFELFCKGKRWPVARYPNKGWMHIGQIVEGDVGEQPKLVDGNKQGKTFQYADDRPARWRHAEELELHGFWWFGWMDQHVKVAAISPARKLITLVETPGGGIRKDQWFYALNLLEEIDQPGEWYLNRATGLLYFLPTEDFPHNPLICSTIKEPLLVLDGTSHVTIQGLVIEVTRGVAVVIGGGQDNRLVGCVVRNVGSDAIVVDHGKRNAVVGCDVYSVGGTAIRISGGNRSTLEPSENAVLNSHIHHYAQRKKVYMPAVRLYGCGHRIAHNLIHDAPHQAIAYDGNEHLIELNEIHHVVLESADAGVLYSGCNWTFRGNVVRHNFIHHIPHGPGLGTVGVYLDDCHCATAMIGNVFYDVLKPTFIGGGRDNKIENNVFIECDTPVHLDNRGLRWDHFRPGGPMYEHLKQMRVDQPPWCDRYPELARILDECPQAPLGNTLLRNVSYKSSWRDPEAHVRATSKKNIDRKYMTIADNYVTDDDPGFVDAAKMDFRLRADSVVYEKIPGFKPIPFEKIGIYEDEYRASLPIRDSAPPTRARSKTTRPVGP